MWLGLQFYFVLADINGTGTESDSENESDNDDKVLDKNWIKLEMSMQHILSLTRQFEALNEQCERGSNHILKLVDLSGRVCCYFKDFRAKIEIIRNLKNIFMIHPLIKKTFSKFFHFL